MDVKVGFPHPSSPYPQYITMQFKSLAALSILAVATTVGASPATNAERMARGLGPLPPKRMFSPSNVQGLLSSNTSKTAA